MFPQLNDDLQEAVKQLHDMTGVSLDVTEYVGGEVIYGSGQYADNGHQDTSQEIHDALDEQYDLKIDGGGDKVLYYDLEGRNHTHVSRRADKVFRVTIHGDHEENRWGEEVFDAHSFEIVED